MPLWAAGARKRRGNSVLVMAVREVCSRNEEKTMSALNTIAVASLLLGLQVAVAVADGPPKLDLAPTCDAAARFSISASRR